MKEYAVARKVERLTALGAKGLSKPGMYPDGDGLYLNVAAGGSKSWILRYRINGKRRDMGLGKYPLFSLADARERARLHRRDLADNLDPLEKRRAERQQVRAKAARGITFQEAAEACILAKRDAWSGGDQEHQWRQSLRDHVFLHIGDRPVAEIDLALVESVLKPLWAKIPPTARRIGRRIEAVLDYATVKGYRTGDNPARMKGNLEHLLAKKARGESGRHEALPYREIGKFMVELHDARPELAARALEFAILTGARTNEVRGATWAEIDLERRLWTIPASRMKMGKEHRVPLSDVALALLAALPKDRDLLFKIGERGMYHVAKALRPGITTHGFRSTFRDWAYETQPFPREIVEHCLAHIEGPASELAYKRGEALEKRAEVMEAWARFCAQPAPAGDNVRAIRAAG
jgi:integrase